MENRNDYSIFTFCLNRDQFIQTIKEIKSIDTLKITNVDVLLLDILKNSKFVVKDGEIVKKCSELSKDNEIRELFNLHYAEPRAESETRSNENIFIENYCIEEDNSFFHINISHLDFLSLKSFIEFKNTRNSFENYIFLSRDNKEIKFKHLWLDSYKLTKNSNEKVYYIDPYLYKNYLTCFETYNEIKSCFEENHKLTICYNSKFDQENLTEKLKNERDETLDKIRKSHEIIDKDNFHDRHIITNSFIIDFNSGSDIINTDENIFTKHGKLKKNKKATGIKLFIPYKQKQIHYYNKLLKYLNLNTN